MSTLPLGSAILEIYPEQSPFDLDPPLFNLTPSSPFTLGDSPEFHAACREVAQRCGDNPLSMSYGTNPLVVFDPRAAAADLPLPHYQPAPPMQRISLPKDTEFLEQINHDGNTPLLKVRVDGNVRLLKVFSDKETSLEGYRKPEQAPPHPLVRYAREKAAYEHLLHYGACAEGAVPQCYGWLELSAGDMDKIALVPAVTTRLRNLKKDIGPPKAFLLGFFEDAAPVSIENVTEAVADSALRALCAIHASYVVYRDVSSRNILVLLGGRVVWVDFVAAATPSDPKRSVRRQDFLRELGKAWTHFYMRLLPDKRIGFRHWLY